MRFTIATQSTFNYNRTMDRHAWSGQLTFKFIQPDCSLASVYDLGTSNPVLVKITGTKRELLIDTISRLSKGAAESVTRDVRHMFRLDDDMSPFYNAMSADPDFAWIAIAGAGRMLRSPTVFEDL